MTEKEHIKLSRLGDHFWLAYSRLIAETLKQAPEHLRPHLLAMLQDKSSVYGSVYERYMQGDSVEDPNAG
jgi:hypothetical protein